MEVINKILKKSGWSSLLTSVILAILGIILIAKPEGTVKVVSYIIGITFIIIGAYKTINYFITKERNGLFNYELAYGIIAIILGIITIVYSKEIVSVLRIIMGIWIIYSSILRINLSFELKKLENSVWISSLIIAIIMVFCGIFILFTSNVIIVTIGVVILIYSILDIIESIIFLKDLNKLTK